MGRPGSCKIPGRMTQRHTLTLVALALTLGAGCNLRHPGLEDGDAAITDTDADVDVDAGNGVCCPGPGSFVQCSVPDPLPGGGWAPSLEECDYTIDGFDIHFEPEVDARGCDVWRDSGECCACPPDPPAPPPSDCSGLGEAACLAAGCVPTYHDACCSSCEPGAGCADCVDYQFWECQTFADACEATFCSMATPWGCGTTDPACGGASITGPTSCDIVGCVPAVGAEGSMEPVAPCVPVTAATCAPVICLAIAPACPDGTTAEADGFCWTGRCIPGSVCGG